MPSCVVRWCRNQQEYCPRSTGITFHVFPQDPSRRNRWKKAVQLERQENDWTPSKNSKICSVHFKDEDFYVSKKGHRMLSKSAIPICTMVFSSEKPVVIKIKNKENIPETSQESPQKRQLVSCPSCGHHFDITEQSTQSLSPELSALAAIPDSLEANRDTSLNVLSSDIESAFNTPKTQRLKKEVRKKTVLSQKRLSKIQSLRRRIKRLIKKYVSLKDLAKELRKNKFIDTDLQNNLSNISSEIFSSIKRKHEKGKRSIVNYKPGIPPVHETHVCNTESSACCRRPSDAEHSAWSHIMTAECGPVKEEPEWVECDVSETAIAEGLYASHEVKDEMVFGPELMQQQDIAFSMQNALRRTDENPCKPKIERDVDAVSECTTYTHTCSGDEPHCNCSIVQQYRLRSCFVRLERLPVEDQHSCNEVSTHTNIGLGSRSHIIALHNEGKNLSEIARETGVNRKTVVLWVRRFQEEGSLHHRQRTGRPRLINAAQRQAILKEYEENGSISTNHYAALFDTSADTIRRVLHNVLSRAEEDACKLKPAAEAGPAAESTTHTNTHS